MGISAGFNVFSVAKGSVLDARDLLLMNPEEEEDRTRNLNQEILSVKLTETAFKVLLQSKVAINSAIRVCTEKLM